MSLTCLEKPLQSLQLPTVKKKSPTSFPAGEDSLQPPWPTYLVSQPTMSSNYLDAP